MAKQQKNDSSGIVLLAKKSGNTSFSSLWDIKHALDTDKVGHTGTLDSFADGLLVILSGNLTHLVPHITGFRKQYEAVVCFGKKTDTLDPTGEIIETGNAPTEEEVKNIISKFTGAILQVPPLYSAVHVDGKRASDIARKNKKNITSDLTQKEVKIEPRQIFIYKNELIDFLPANDKNPCSYALLKIECSKGTYIRSIARDMAEALGTCGHLSALRRISVGPFLLKDAVGFNELSEFNIQNGIKWESQAVEEKKKREENSVHTKKEHDEIRDKKVFAEIRNNFSIMTPELARKCGFKCYELKSEFETNYLHGRPLEHKMFMELKTYQGDNEENNSNEEDIVDQSVNQYALFYKSGMFAGIYLYNGKKYSYGFVVPPTNIYQANGQSDCTKKTLIYTWNDIIEGKFPIQFVKTGTSISVGSFDGIHAGHQKIFDKIKEQRKLIPGIVTFRKPIKSNEGDEVITLSQKLQFCADNGIMFVIVIDFSDDFAKIEGIDFIRYLVQFCGMKYLAEGNDFTCGYKGSFNVDNIKQFALEDNTEKEHFDFETVDDVIVDEERVSSSRIRDAVKKANFGLVQKMLLRPFSYDCSQLVWKKLEQVGNQWSYSSDSNFVQVLPPDGTFNVVAMMSGSDVTLSLKETDRKTLYTYKTICILECGKLRLLLPSDKDSVYIRALNFIPVDNYQG